jgi:hypothetical protein
MITATAMGDDKRAAAYPAPGRLVERRLADAVTA